VVFVYLEIFYVVEKGSPNCPISMEASIIIIIIIIIDFCRIRSLSIMSGQNLQFHPSIPTMGIPMPHATFSVAWAARELACFGGWAPSVSCQLVAWRNYHLAPDFDRVDLPCTCKAIIYNWSVDSAYLDCGFLINTRIKILWPTTLLSSDIKLQLDIYIHTQI